MLNFTVAIRTHNGATRIPALLDRLRSQTDTDGIAWEVLLVDNNSTDETAQVVQTYQANWPIAAPLRYCFEPEQGAAIARRRAIQEAQGTWIGFLDDDNIPATNWVATAHAFTQTHPQVGAFGGQIHGQYEGEPPANFGKIALFLAVVARKTTFCYNSDQYGQPKRNVLPVGAGLVVRRQAWLDHVPDRQVLQGPIGNQLALKGEDMEALLYLSQAGWEIWNNAELHIDHHIPQWRLERDYLLRLCQGVGLGKYRLRLLTYQTWQKPFITLAYFLNDLRKAIVFFLQHQRQLQTDVVTACEMEILVYTLISPFYLWSKRR